MRYHDPKASFGLPSFKSLNSRRITSLEAAHNKTLRDSYKRSKEAFEASNPQAIKVPTNLRYKYIKVLTK